MLFILHVLVGEASLYDIKIGLMVKTLIENSFCGQNFILSKMHAKPHSFQSIYRLQVHVHTTSPLPIWKLSGPQTFWDSSPVGDWEVKPQLSDSLSAHTLCIMTTGLITAIFGGSNVIANMPSLKPLNFIGLPYGSDKWGSTVYIIYICPIENCVDHQHFEIVVLLTTE